MDEELKESPLTGPPLKAAPSFGAFLIDEKQPIGAYEISNQVFEPNKLDAIENAEEKPGFAKTISATVLDSGNFLYRKAMSISNTALNLSEMITKPEAGRFNFLESEYKDSMSPEYWPELSTAVTEGEFFRKAAAIQTREQNAQIKEEGSTLGWLTGELVNGVTNPFYYAAVGQGIKGITWAAGAKSIFTHSIPTFMLGVGMDEVDAVANHNLHSAEEGAKNVAIAGLMGGILGAAGIGARSLKLNTYKKLVTEMVDGNDVKFWMNDKGGVRGFTISDDSVGARSLRHLELVGESLYGWGKDGELHAATPLLWLTGKIGRNPVVRGLTSKSSFVRGFINDTLEHNMDLTSIVKDFKAPPEALQTAIRNRQAAIFNFQLDLADGYYEYLNIDPEKNFLSKAVASKFKNKEGLYDFGEYTKQFYLATVEGGVHKNAGIASRSKKFIDERLVPVYNELVELDLIAPNLTPKGAAQHVMRIYDREFISSNKHNVKKFLMTKFSMTNDKVAIEMEPISRAETRLSGLKEDLKGVTNKETKAKLHSDIKKLEEEVEKLHSNIQTKIKEGKYSDDMIVGDAKKGDLRLRAIRDADQIIDAADETIRTITGLTEEQMSGQMMSYLRTGTGGTNPFKERTLMISDVDLINEKMLISDIRKSFGAYSMRTSRLIEMEKFMRAAGRAEGQDNLSFLAEQIRDDYSRLEQSLEAKYAQEIAGKSGKALEKTEAAYAKKRLALDESIEDDIKTVSTVYKRLMGETGVKYGKTLKFANAAKKWMYATELGSMALLMLQDSVVPMFRIGAKRYLNQGVRPFLENLSRLDFKANGKLMDQAIHLGLGIDVLSAFHNINFTLERDSFVPLNTFERLADNAANAMGIANGSSIMGDMFKFVAATASQSSIAADLMALKEGKDIGEKYLRRLLNLRLTPNEGITDAIVQQVIKHGEKRRGAWIPNVHLWGTEEGLSKEAYKSIAEAARKFEGAIQKEVNSTMFVGSNMASYPIGGEPNGLLGAFLMYMGWGFNATMNYTIPLAQKFDINRWGTAMMMMGIGSMVDPLRKLSHGQELDEEDLDPAMMFKKGILNSGVLGMYADLFNKVNSMGDIFPGARINRYKNTRGLVQFGPERIIADVANIAGMFVNREWNKKDWKRAIKNVPLANLIYTRKIVNDWIDSWDIPETRHKASILKEWQ